MTAAAATTPEQYDVALAVRGDSAAFERLYRAHVNRVAALARWLLGGDDVEDAVQDAFIRAWQKLGTFSGESAFGTWLHRVAVNLFLRRRQQRSTFAARQVDDPDAMLSARGPAERPDLRVALEGAVCRLPAGAREVFVLHGMELPSALSPQIKATNFLNNILAKREASAARVFDALLLNWEGHLTECTVSNVFFAAQGRLYTPSVECGLLDRITRAILLQMAEELKIPVHEGRFTPEELLQADECFLRIPAWK